MIQHPKLYRKDSKGKLRVWWVETTEMSASRAGPEVGLYRIWDGLVGGKHKPSEWTECAPKNVGKVNATTSVSQRDLEVKALYTKKLDRKYSETPEAASEGKDTTFPMLAKTFSGASRTKGLKEGVQHFCQPKLDGIRCIAKVVDGKVTLWSREGKPFTYLGHIEEALEPLFAAFPSAILDGELYNHGLRDDFNSIVSAVKSGRMEEAELIQYHIYDCAHCGPDRFSWRTAWLKGVIERLTKYPIVWVQTHLVTSMLTLNSLYDHYLAQGYEGQMVRRDGPYEQGKRSPLLLKRKEFQDEEFPVANIEEGVGNWKGYAKRATLRLPDGRTFGAGIKGSREYCKALLALWVSYTGDRDKFQATVQFFKLTPDGVPRFPVAKTFWPEGRNV